MACKITTNLRLENYGYENKLRIRRHHRKDCTIQDWYIKRLSRLDSATSQTPQIELILLLNSVVSPNVGYAPTFTFSTASNISPSSASRGTFLMAGVSNLKLRLYSSSIDTVGPLLRLENLVMYSKPNDKLRQAHIMPAVKSAKLTSVLIGQVTLIVPW